MKDKAPFKSMDREQPYFSTFKEVYYEDPNIKKVFKSINKKV